MKPVAERTGTGCGQPAYDPEAHGVVSDNALSVVEDP